jgi:NAD(P)-dependent dehydrogenase (short-subunit alcohol dehydrogenase family)
VNLNGVFDSAHLALYYFKQTLKPEETGDKQIIFISSLAGYVTLNQIPDYTASKFGVRGIWKAFRNNRNILSESGTPRFRANLIAPTFIKTNMTKNSQAVLPYLGITFGEVEDMVVSAVRIACDDTIEGRAVAIASRDKVPGDRNFDLLDDHEGYDAGKEILNKIVDGTVNNIHLLAVPGGYKKPDA